MALARVILSGIIQNEPEKRFTSNNIAVTNFTIEVPQHTAKNDAPFYVRVTCWRNLADIATERLHKGMPVTVEGRLQINQYETPEGLNKRTYEVDASNVFMGQLQSIMPAAHDGYAQKPQAPSPNAAGMQQTPSYQPIPAAVGSPSSTPTDSYFNSDLLTEDDIPF